MGLLFVGRFDWRPVWLAVRRSRTFVSVREHIGVVVSPRSFNLSTLVWAALGRRLVLDRDRTDWDSWIQRVPGADSG